MADNQEPKRLRLSSPERTDVASTSQIASASTSDVNRDQEQAADNQEPKRQRVSLPESSDVASTSQIISASTSDLTRDQQEPGVSRTVTQNLGPITANIVAANIGTINYNTPAPPTPGGNVRNADIESILKEVCNGRAKREASQFRIEGLHKPETRVDPDTSEVDFFNTAVPEQGYQPNFDFIQQKQKQKGRSIIRKNFFDDLKDGSRARTVAVVGGAGYGKTEMLRRFADDVVRKDIPSLTEVEVVHYLNFRDLAELPKMLTTGKLLFGVTVLGERGLIEKSVDWILANGKKVLLVIDGADQYPDKKGQLGKDSSFELYKTDGKKTMILNSILSGKLFPGIRVLYSSREHTIRHFEDGVRPNRVVALAGFPQETIKTLVHELAGDKGTAVWELLTTKSPTLLSASSIPLILIFNVSVLIRHIGNPPETFTEVLMHVLNDLTTSSSVRNPSRIHDVIHELKAMCFQGTKARKVTFTKCDLPAHIKEEDYRDLIIPILGSYAMNQRLAEGMFRFFFLHEIIQECLAALHLAEMEIQDFEKYVAEDLHTPHWAIVRRLLCGILVNKSARQIAKGIDPSTGLLRSVPSEAKLKCLKESLEQQIQGQSHSQGDFLELLHAIHECGDDVIASSVKEIDVWRLILTQSDMHVITTTVSRCSQLELLYLPELDDKEKLHTLASTLRKSECKIKELNFERIDLQHLTFTEHDINDLETVISRCSYIGALHLPALDTTHLRRLASAMEMSSVGIIGLFIWHERYLVLPHEGAIEICDMLPYVRYGVVQLDCRLDDASVELLQDKMNDLGDEGPEEGISYYNINGEEKTIVRQ